MLIPGSAGGQRAWKRVLVVGHRERLDAVLRRLLDGREFRVESCNLPADAEVACARDAPDLLVLLSAWPAFTCTFVFELRRYTSVPILIVCDPREEPLLPLFEAGADDVVPFGTPADELAARARALVRRATRAFNSGLQPCGHGGAALDLGRLRLRLPPGRELQLTESEFRFLLALATAADSTVRYVEIAEAVWGTRHDAGESTRTLVKRLRQKLGADRDLVRSHYGIGYYLGGAPDGAAMEDGAAPGSVAPETLR